MVDANGGCRWWMPMVDADGGCRWWMSMVDGDVDDATPFLYFFFYLDRLAGNY